jgi:hypothetical protein
MCVIVETIFGIYFVRSKWSIARQPNKRNRKFFWL